MGVDGNRTHQEPRKRPLNGFEDRCARDVTPQPISTYNPHDTRLTDVLTELGGENPELACVVRNWASLPDAVRAGIVAMVEASGAVATGGEVG